MEILTLQIKTSFYLRIYRDTQCCHLIVRNEFFVEQLELWLFCNILIALLARFLTHLKGSDTLWKDRHYCG